MKALTILLGGASLLALAACDSKEEQRRERALERNNAGLKRTADGG